MPTLACHALGREHLVCHTRSTESRTSYQVRIYEGERNHSCRRRSINRLMYISTRPRTGGQAHLQQNRPQSTTQVHPWPCRAKRSPENPVEKTDGGGDCGLTCLPVDTSQNRSSPEASLLCRVEPSRVKSKDLTLVLCPVHTQYLRYDRLPSAPLSSPSSARPSKSPPPPPPPTPPPVPPPVPKVPTVSR